MNKNKDELKAFLSSIMANKKPKESVSPAVSTKDSEKTSVPVSAKTETASSNSKKEIPKDIKKIFLYETLSETNFNLLSKSSFKPNYYVNISKTFKSKLKALKIYKSEIGKHPFPRSVASITSLAKLRGSESGYKFAEGFKLIFERDE